MTVHDSGANRMKARRAVSAQRGEKRKSNAELVDHLSAGRGDIGSIVFEILPSRHRSVLLQAIYLRHLFAYVKGELFRILASFRSTLGAGPQSTGRILNRAQNSALYMDPHLHPRPNRARRQKVALVQAAQFLRGTKYCVPAPARSISRISSARSPGLATKSMSVVSTTSSGASS